MWIEMEEVTMMTPAGIQRVAVPVSLQPTPHPAESKLARIEALAREFSDGHIGSTVGAVCRKVLAIIEGKA